MPEPKDKKPLSDKHESFCINYVRLNNATKAYMAVYPESNPKSAEANSSRLIGNDKVKKRIAYLKNNLAEAAGVSTLMIVEEHKKMAFTSIAHMHNTWVERKEFENLTPEQKACIAEIKTRTRKVYSDVGESIGEVEEIQLKLYDKQKSLAEIAKLIGGYPAEKRDYTYRAEQPLFGDVPKNDGDQ